MSFSADLGLPGYAESSLSVGMVDGDTEITPDEWDRLRRTLAAEFDALKRVRLDRTAQRIRSLGRHLRLSRTDVALLELLLRYETDPLVESMVDEVLCDRGFGRIGFRAFSVANPGLADLLGISMGTVRRRLAMDAPLVQSGLVSVEDDGDFDLLERLKRLAHAPPRGGTNVQQLLFDKAPAAELEWRDFDHVAPRRDHVERLIRGALKTGERGVNVLIYGLSGTGKTEFCRTLAQRLGVALYSIGEADERGREPSRSGRLQELRLAERVLGDCRNSILLFDEMEDLLADRDSIWGWLRSEDGSRSADGSKVFMNRLLERTRVPTFWTTNSARQTCPTVLRRMMFALELRQPSARVRARIWARQLARQGIPSREEDAEALAREFDVTPGVAAGATVAARLVEGGDIATVRRGVESLSRLLHGPKPPRAAPRKFDPALVRADTDLAELADSLAERGRRRFSVCLQGPPGTGKSAFVRYLAGRVGLEVSQKRASDLLSMWVGQTEARISEAFAEAREQRRFLVFDEADSLLADRRFAHRNWEVSQVNEMLAWMENHPLPFACTTNYGEHLDPATLRRFDFKLRLDYLAPDQVAAAFRTFFELEPPGEVRALSNLTPGDFAVVRRRAEVLGRLNDAKSIAAMLREECDVKPGHSSRIGFRVQID
ncbi:MAG: AAA family ATPase [Gammaproteobacteria bacterium]|nr:AAA family ATPase [Gammaproteobacteria bacterium]